jgi:hypothetical protein
MIEAGHAGYPPSRLRGLSRRAPAGRWHSNHIGKNITLSANPAFHPPDASDDLVAATIAARRTPAAERREEVLA